MDEAKTSEAVDDGNGPTSTCQYTRDYVTVINWAWFPANMATGSIAVLLFQTPRRFRGLITLGKVVFILDLIVFSFSIAMIVLRFVKRAKALARSLRDPEESFYLGTFWVSVALVLQNISIYSVLACGPWLIKTLEVMFWCCVACVIVVAVFHYQALFILQNIPISAMTPAWMLPIYPLLVMGPLVGVLGQGLGWMVVTFLYVLWTIRLLQHDIPDPAQRPGMYIAVGPTGYTAQALFTLGSMASKALPAHFFGATASTAGETIHVLGAAAGMFLWLLVFWFFGLSTVSILQGYRRMTFNLTWWGFIFSNAGLTLATIEIGNILGSSSIQWATSVMTILLFLGWLVLSILEFKAIWRGRNI